MKKVAFEGRQIAKSVLPSPSKSPFIFKTGILIVAVRPQVLLQPVVVLVTVNVSVKVPKLPALTETGLPVAVLPPPAKVPLPEIVQL